MLARLLLLLIALGAGVQTGQFEAKVVGVADGDTITVLRDGRVQITVRLDGIDCPEGGQAFSNRAKEFTSDLVFGQVVTLEPRDKDRYGRTVARVYVDGFDVGLALVKAGLAWHFKRYSTDDTLAQAEIAAREGKRGLWADPHAIAPWDYRNPSGPSASGQPAAQPLVGAAVVYHGNLRSKVFHAPGCRDYDCPNCRQVLSSIAEAEAAGFRRHVACVR